MIHIKSKEDIEIMKVGGKMLSETLWEVLEHAKPGVQEIELDKLAERLIREKGGESGFKKVPGYHWTICTSTNDVVVHGIPGKYTLKEGDIIGVDCGVYYKGFHTDMAQTLCVRTQNSKLKTQNETYEIDRFLETGERALKTAIITAKVGNHIGHISQVIQQIVEKEGGYSITRSLIGHGVGRELHEEPEIPGFLRGSIEHTPKLKEGMVIAIEIIYNMGKKEITFDDDGWTIRTRDGSLSGVFERTVAITQSGPIVLTR